MKKNNSKGCCKDDKKTIKNQQEQVNPDKFLDSFFAQALVTPIFALNFQSPFYRIILAKKLQIPPPPLLSGIKLHILNCTFRI